MFGASQKIGYADVVSCPTRQRIYIHWCKRDTKYSVCMGISTTVHGEESSFFLSF
jgi:hypothetical protein